MTKNSKFKTETLTKNESEKIFEQYLNSNGYQEKWAYEPTIPGKSKKPDYMLNFNNKNCFFEVKELRKKPDEPNFPAYINPYKSLRSEINEVRRQFKEYKNYSCSLVVFNIDDRQARLAPLYVYGAMLGNLGLEMDYDPEKGEVDTDSARNVFDKKGKMINYKRLQPQNKTISTVVVLENFRDDSEIQKATREKVNKQSKPLTQEKWHLIIEDIVRIHHSVYVPRVVIVENPFATIVFPENLFVGPFDERWKIQNDKIERVFAGDAIKEIESLKSNT
jgi:hypothetical protein